jgi:hypothetical protein
MRIRVAYAFARLRLLHAEAPVHVDPESLVRNGSRCDGFSSKAETLC